MSLTWFRRHWQLLVVAIIAIATVGGVYVFAVWPYQQKVISIDFSTSRIGKEGRLYVKEDSNTHKFGNEEGIIGPHTREVLTGPINIGWEPAQFPLDTSVTLSLTLQADTDWDMSTVCNECGAGDQFLWMPMHRSILKQYQIARTYDNVHAYVPDMNTIKNNEVGSMKEWLETNVPINQSVLVLDKSFDLSQIAIAEVPGHNNNQTMITTPLRGSHQFYVFLDKSFSLQLIKEDLNRYPGTDEVTVSLLDLNNEVVYENKMEDDRSIKGNNSGLVQKTFTTKNIPAKGVYRLLLNGNDDWVLRKLVINTNKIVATGRILPYSTSTLYTNAGTSKVLSAEIGQATAAQTIPVTSKTKKYQLDVNAERVGQPVRVTVEPGNYQLTTRGQVYLSGAHFAFAPDQYFEPFTYDLTNTISPQAIISSLKQTTDGEWTTSELVIPAEQFKRLPNLKTVEFTLRSPTLSKKYDTQQILEEKGYQTMATYSPYIIMRSNDEKVTVPREQGRNLRELIADSIPNGSSVALEPDSALTRNDFTIVSALDSQATTTVIPGSWRGNHSWYVQLNATQLVMQLTKRDINQYIGADAVLTIITDIHGKEVCRQLLADDGSVKNDSRPGQQSFTIRCNRLQPGVYKVALEEQATEGGLRSDFIFSNIRFNSNKVVFTGTVLPVEPVTLYTSVTGQASLQAYYWLAGKEQTITINNQQNNARSQSIALTKEDQSKTRTINLHTGTNQIILPKGFVRLDGVQLATDANHLFAVYSHYVSKDPLNSASEFVVLNYEPTWFKEFTITVAR